MGVKKFFIELDNPNRSYFPGESVSGRVVVISTSNKKIELLTVKFLGKAQVSWSEKIKETKSKDQSRKSVYFKNEQEYFNTEFSLIGTHFVRRSDERRDFPFSFPLPLGLPSSFVGKAGQVFYYLEARLRKSGMGTRTIDNKVLFTVNGIVDLNVDPGSNQAAQVRKYKSLCCFCCRSGPVGFVLHLQRRGYVPGETLRFVIDLSNQSNQKVKGVTVSLIQNVMFHAKGNTLEDIRVVRKVRGPTVGLGENEMWEGDFFQVPPIPPTRLGNCAIIDVQYSIKVEMQIAGMSTNLTGATPITIGTIPLRTTFQELAAQNSVTLTHTDPGPSRMEFNAQVPCAPGFEGYPDLPPPSYAESMEGRQWVQLDAGIPNKSFSSAAISKRSNSSNKISETDPAEQNENDLVRDFVPNYVTYGWTAESGNAFRMNNVVD